MRSPFRAASLMLLLLLGLSTSLSAGAIKWQASGTIANLTDPFGTLGSIAVGLPWSLEFTFDPDALGHSAFGNLPPTYYSGAVTDARFTVGDFAYTNSRGDIAINYGFPIGDGVSPLSGPGLVQFQWIQGWVGAHGGPNLNFGSGLLLASYNDVNAVGGQIPTFPTPAASQGLLAGLLWDAFPNSGQGPQFTSDFSPAPVPEPATMLLMGSGLIAMMARRARLSRKR